MAWSLKQLQAIEARDVDILVAAAAGSGKTSVLVERIIRRITDEVRPVDVDRILVVTFTNAAAAEMRERIGLALTEAMAKRPSRQLARQLALLPSASVSTLHAFCQQVIRQNIHELEMDPRFRVAQTAEVEILRQDVLDELLEDSFAAGDAAFLRLADQYCRGSDDRPLRDCLMELYEYSCAQENPEAWLQSLARRFVAPDGLDATPWAAVLKRRFARDWEQAFLQLESLRQEAERRPALGYATAVLEQDALWLSQLQAAVAGTWDEIAQVLAAGGFVRMPNAPKGTPEEDKEWLRKGRDGVKAKVKAVQEAFFSRTADEWLSDLPALREMAQGLAGLAVEFGRRFLVHKRRRAIVDFHDLEHECLRALTLPDGGAERQASPVAMALQERFEEIMVDEYQDTNGVQEAILRLVARRDRPNLFQVGDVKQSIYRFRLAEPELFLDKYQVYPARPGRALRVDLNQNFRSRPGVLGAVNFLFRQWWSADVAELDYGPEEWLYPGLEYPPDPGEILTDEVELCLLERNGAAEEEDREEELPDEGGEQEREEATAFELEAQWIARRIVGLKAAGTQVYDRKRNGYRPLEWRDIVILLRAPSGKGQVLLDALREQGVAAYADVDGGYFRELEVQVMLSLLQVLDNPRQDIPLAAVLRSPIGGFGDAELAAIRAEAHEGDLWQALLLWSAEKTGGLAERVTALVQQVEQWRTRARRCGVPELLGEIYEQTGYYHYVAGMPGGLFRQANLRALYDRARQYEQTSYRGLFRFLRFIDTFQEQGGDLAVARPLGESENLVRVMSIHKSKGLEFPVVFVADLGKAFNLRDSTAMLPIHRTLGIGPYVIDGVRCSRYPSLPRQAVAYQLQIEARAEELRILYVAATRAREKLIFVGSCRGREEQLQRWRQTAAASRERLPDSTVAHARTYLDWLVPAVLRHPQAGSLWPGGEVESAAALPDASRWLFPAGTEREESGPGGHGRQVNADEFWQVARQDRPDIPWVAAQLDWQYPCGIAARTAAKISVSEMKRRFEFLRHGEAVPLIAGKAVAGRPRFLLEQQRLTAAEAGTAVHAVLQHLEPAGDMSEAGVGEQVAGLVEREILLPEQAAAVDAAAVARFFATPLGERLRQAERLERELPFSRMVAAEQLYPELAGCGEEVFVQGVIDAAFQEADGWVLVDYKTDIAPPEELAVRYRIQLQLYQEALEAICKMPVKEKYIYSFHHGKVIAIQ